MSSEGFPSTVYESEPSQLQLRIKPESWNKYKAGILQNLNLHVQFFMLLVMKRYKPKKINPTKYPLFRLYAEKCALIQAWSSRAVLRVPWKSTLLVLSSFKTGRLLLIKKYDKSPDIYLIRGRRMEAASTKAGKGKYFLVTRWGTLQV